MCLLHVGFTTEQLTARFGGQSRPTRRAIGLVIRTDSKTEFTADD